jgi:predicted GNAT superfamily acetyltransferase
MSNSPPAIVLRDIIELSEMREVESLQKEIWGVEDREVFPVLALRPLIEVGAILIGAFDRDQMVGFVFGFPGLEKNRPILHSDMLAVKLAYRSSGLGYQLKLAQRERALARNIDTISWTFDPLQSVNAHFNFKKLGVVADRYMINFYGETSSFLHRAGTDRLWVTWLLNSERVNRRISQHSVDDIAWSEPGRVAAVVQVGNNFEPVTSNSGTPEPRLIIEIPGDLNRIVEERVRLATRWRETTREAFTTAMDAGYVVEDFCLAEKNGQKVGVYLLALRDRVTDHK